MLEQSQNERKLLAIERAKFKLKQRLEAIEWDYAVLKPLIAEFKAKARLPELPSATIVEVIDERAPHQTPRRARAKGARLGSRKSTTRVSRA